jgi:hypothetical protein
MMDKTTTYSISPHKKIASKYIGMFKRMTFNGGASLKMSYHTMDYIISTFTRPVITNLVLTYEACISLNRIYHILIQVGGKKN